MQISNYSAMSNLIPPMISDSPPPLDVAVDDNDDDDDDGFGDFRVAADLAFDLSDTSVGRDSPDVWNTPSTYSEPSDDKLPKLVTNSPSKSIAGFDKGNTGEEIMVNGVDDKKPTNDNGDFDDTPEVIEELEGIPSFEPSSSVIPSFREELEKRTSPEGADAEDTCVQEEEFQFKVPSEPSDSAKNDKLNSSNSPVLDTVNDDFDDFADFSSQQPQPSPPLPPSHLTNDDDDFDDFEFAAPPVVTPTTEDEDLGAKLAAIFETNEPEVCLPNDDPQLTGCLHSCLDDSSSVWGHLKDLETSHALALQWTSSSASRKLLSSLNVDSRNILIGQRWNSSMPRFAANLGCAPLEPMKATAEETTEATPPLELRPTAPGSEDVVPAAQFDWTSSGLTNPLDCMDKEETAVSKQSATQEVKTHQSSDIWESSVADILLPSPVGPDPAVLEPISILPSQPKPDQIIDSNWPEMANSISSQLKETEATMEPKISEEARRVVESLPDLSFLSAKKLLYAANASRSRFLARP